MIKITPFIAEACIFPSLSSARRFASLVTVPEGVTLSVHTGGRVQLLGPNGSHRGWARK